jgi:competence protein ComEC
MIATAFLLMAFIAAGATAAQLFERRFPPNHVSHLAGQGVDLEDPVRLQGQLIATPIRSSYGYQFDLELSRAESRGQAHPITGKVRLRMLVADDPASAALAEDLHLDYGDTIRVLARLRRPRIYQNPGGFDFRRWMEAVDDIVYVGTIKSPHLIEKLAGDRPPRTSRWVHAARRRLLEGITRLYPPWSAEGRNGAVLKAVLLGDRSSLDSDTIENFRKTGLYHLLVISGLHVGLLAMLAGLALRRLPISETWRSITLLALLLGYAVIVEQRAPTLRATLMIAAYLIGRFLYREHSLLNAVALAGLILLMLRPPWLFESGFQLSFSAALLIAALAVPVLERTIEPYRRALRGIEEVDRDASFAPRLAQIRLDIRMVVQFLRKRLTILDHHPQLATAVVAVPLLAGLWAAGILLFSAVLQLGLLLPMAETFHRVTYAGIGLNALAIPVMTALLAWLSYRVPEPSLWVSIGFAMSVIFAAWSLGRMRRALWLSAVMLTLFGGLISLHPFAPRLPANSLEVTVLDCGGGDSIFVVLPGPATMLVDGCGSRTASSSEGAFGGRRWDPGEDIISPYLWSRGVSKIDVVALSHAHQDHLGGLGAVLRNFRVGEFWHARTPMTDAYSALLAEADKQRVPDRQLSSGERVKFSGSVVEILWPPVDRPVEDRPSNDDSLVMRVSAGSSSVLLVGDISEKVEHELVSKGTTLRSQVLKVAHHGAKTSSSAEFLAGVSPSVALITGASGGLANLPSPETLDRLRAISARPYQANVVGAVTAEMQGNKLVVRVYAPPPRK